MADDITQAFRPTLPVGSGYVREPEPAQSTFLCVYDDGGDVGLRMAVAECAADAVGAVRAELQKDAVNVWACEIQELLSFWFCENGSDTVQLLWRNQT